MKTAPPNLTDEARTQRVLARLRRKQLDLAISGQVTDSARYARRARRVRLFGRRPSPVQAA